MNNERWFYDAVECSRFCRELTTRGASYVRQSDRGMERVRWIEWYEWIKVGL